MEYIFAKERKNYEDLSSGRVLYSQPGAPSFPVRLASEIYQRCQRHLQQKGVNGPFIVYDPCCGGAYLLAVLGFMYGNDLGKIIASDIDGEMITLARKNLSLLSLPGIERRIGEIEGMIRAYGKESHTQALQSARRLRAVVESRDHPIAIDCHRAGALDTDAVRGIRIKPDMVITDVPYGVATHWSDAGKDPINKMLSNLLPLLKPESAVALISDKAQTAHHDAYLRIQKFNIGRRRVTLMKPHSH